MPDTLHIERRTERRSFRAEPVRCAAIQYGGMRGSRSSRYVGPLLACRTQRAAKHYARKLRIERLRSTGISAPRLATQPIATVEFWRVVRILNDCR